MQKKYHYIDLLPRGSGKSFNMDRLFDEANEPKVMVVKEFNRSQRRKQKYQKGNKRGGKINEQYQ